MSSTNKFQNIKKEQLEHIKSFGKSYDVDFFQTKTGNLGVKMGDSWKHVSFSFNESDGEPEWHVIGPGMVKKPYELKDMISECSNIELLINLVEDSMNLFNQ